MNDQPSSEPAHDMPEPSGSDHDGRPAPILLIGPAGWLSGPCPDPGGPEELLRPFAGRWQIDVQPSQVPMWWALRERGSERRIIVAFSAPELAVKLAAVEVADGL
jgi:hypothetical protein